MKFDWKKVAKPLGVLALGSLIAILLCRNDEEQNELEDWLHTASDDDLYNGYHQRREEWIRTGCGETGEKTYEMKRIDEEMSRRSAEKWENDPHRNIDPNYRWTDEARWDRD